MYDNHSIAAATAGDAAGRLWQTLEAHVSALDGPALAINAGLSVLLIALAAVGSFALSKFARYVFRLTLRSVAAEGAKPKRKRSVVVILAQVAIWSSACVLLLGMWGIDVLSWADSALVAGALQLLAVILVALATWEVSILAIDAAFRAGAARAESPRRAAQLRSLSPLTQGAVRAIIAVFAGLIIISQLGVEIGPLLAGAGVVGIAVGFGAQTLVKDYLTGFSLILEDIVSVGDVARIGDSGGLVETMTLRTIRLRDFDGTLHVIPYSEAQVVHNLTKTFSYYVFNLPVSYDSNIDQALSLMRAIGAEMQAEPRFKDLILEPIEVVGVDQLAESGVVLKARIKTAPIQQWNVGREYNRRIKLAFDEAGVEIPVPHLKLLFSNRALNALAPS